MTTNFSILSFYFVFRYRLCPTYSYSFIIILISHSIYVVFFIVISDITSSTLIITVYTNIILSIIIILVIIIIIIAVIIVINIIIIVIINNYWSVITVITSTSIITDVVHIICAVAITIFNWDFKYKNIGSVTDSFLISPICTDSNCKIIYPSNITNRNPTPIHWCRSETFKGRSVLILPSEET